MRDRERGREVLHCHGGVEGVQLGWVGLEVVEVGAAEREVRWAEGVGVCARVAVGDAGEVGGEVGDDGEGRVEGYLQPVADGWGAERGGEGGGLVDVV